MKWKGILYSAAVLYVVLPVFAFAQTQSTSTGLVPCSGISCTPCDLYSLIQRIVNYLIGLSVPIAVLLMAYAGILLFTANAEPAKISKARRIFSSALVGFLIALSGWLLVQTIINILVSQEYQVGWSWNKLACNGETRLGVNGQDITVSDWLNETIGQGKTVPITTPPPPGLTPTCNGGGNTSNQNTIVVSQYCNGLTCTDTTARNAIAAYNASQAGRTNSINIGSGVLFNSLDPELLQDILNNAAAAGAGSITITSANDHGHASNSNHYKGLAVDIGFDNSTFNSFIEKCYTPVSTFCNNPTYPGYQDSDSFIWVNEYYGCANSDGNHWHLTTNGG